MSETVRRVKTSKKKVLFGETCLLPVDTEVRARLRMPQNPFLRGPRSRGNWCFNVGFELRLLHPNFETGVRELSSWLFSAGLHGLGEPESHFVAFLPPVKGWPIPPETATVKRAVEEVWPLLQEFIIKEYVKGEVSSERLKTFFVKHYRHPFGSAPRKRARS